MITKYKSQSIQCAVKSAAQTSKHVYGLQKKTKLRLNIIKKV